jgi:hypothetical protein
MGRVLTNAVTLQVAVEQTPSVLPGSPAWKLIEPNSIGKFGPMLKKITREPISPNRQRRKGALVDLDSSVEFDADCTFDHVKMFVEGLFFATAKGGSIISVTGVTATGYTHTALGSALATNTLVFARGFANSANNGLKVIGAASTTTESKTAGLTAEATAPAGATIEIAGVQGATGDFQINAGLNLQSTAFNWLTGTNLTVGQFIWVGDTAGGTNSFATAANRGLARVRGITATTLTLDKKSATYVVDAGAAKNINVYWGQFIRNVAVSAADYLERTYQFELAYENLGVTLGTDEYEYATGNFCNEIVFDIPLTSKATMKCNFIGMNTADPTTVRATNAAAGVAPVATAALNTSADMMRLRVTKVDETGITTDFKSLSIAIRNNVSPEKVLGQLGAKYMNAGLFDVEVNASLCFTSSEVLTAMRANTTVTMEACVRNEDGAFIIDIPAMCIEGGDKEFPVNQTVLVSMKSYAHQDPTLGYACSMSTFPYLPSA